MSASLRIFIVDDHDIVRTGIRSILSTDFDVVGEAADASSAIAGIRRERPDVVVLDVKLPGGGGAAVVEAVRRDQPEVRFLALTVSTSRRDVARLFKVGVDGYVSKDTPSEELPDLIRQTHAGSRPMSPDVAAYLLDIDEESDQLPESTLTAREREVVTLIARGYTYRETSKRLGIAVKTLESHMHHIFEKLSVASRNELAALAYERGIVSSPKGDSK